MTAKLKANMIALADTAESKVEVETNHKVELLRFITAGSVDDGKSTLIGRLLFECKSLFQDQLDSIKSRLDGEINFANLTDGLKAEREQGITIDVAYRYFSTLKRRFIIADSPGHVQYTRNMITAAASAQLALVLLDAARGITEQTRRHLYLASLLGVPHVAICVNKMDLVGYSEAKFIDIKAEFNRFSEKLSFQTTEFIPLSALKGENLAKLSDNMSWYQGPTLLSFLESLDIENDLSGPARFPVQWIIKSQLSQVEKHIFRGYAGQVKSGSFKVGDEVVAMPSRKSARIQEIYTLDGLLETASAPRSVTLLLDEEIDVGRGDILVPRESQPLVGQSLRATVCWMQDEPLQEGRLYTIKHCTKMVRAKALRVDSKIDIKTFENVDAEKSLSLNEIGLVSFQLASPLAYDTYKTNRSTGAFIIVDEGTNATAGAGMILES
jgi:sulfate adenylyltransferase subunit 1